jgi:molybdopterin-dependent oxidoreductase alpha subunit
MTARREVPGIKPYHDPAGGWGALRAVARALRDQMDLTDASLLLQTNQPQGFDCPGCAWPDKDERSTFQFCENGAKAVSWEATKKRAPPEFFAAHPVSTLLQWPDHQLEGEGRLTHPMAYDRASDTYRPIAWGAAFARIGEVLQSLPDPNMVEFYTSGRASNEAAFLYQLFAREYGTNNFPDCSNMCHEATSVGLPQSIGIGKGTVSLEDFDHCELIIAIGHNPGTNHPRMMGTLHECSKRGVPIIVFNPLRERALERFADPQDAMEMATLGSTNIASVYHQVRVGGDGAALTGIMKALLAMENTGAGTGAGTGVIDHAFIREHTLGFDELSKSVEAVPWPEIETRSGLRREALEGVAQSYARSNATIVSYGMGVVQHLDGTTNVQQIANLLLMRGNFGKPGAGICPLRGHSNVQGDRTVGITEAPSPQMLDRIEKRFGFKPPSAHGHAAVAALEAMIAGRSRVLISLGGNLPVAMPDPSRCYPAMRNLDLAVHVATKLNRSHLLIGKESIILPCLGRTELDMQADGPQAVTVEDSMSMVHASRGKLRPASEELRSEPAIIAGLALAALPRTRVPWRVLIANYDRIREAIEAVFPDFENFNERIRRAGGFRLPLGPTERRWPTPSGKAEFIAWKRPAGPVPAPGSLTLTTIRSHDQYNTTIYSLGDRYRGVTGRRDIVFMNEDDLRDLGLEHGDCVDIETALELAMPLRMSRMTAIAYDMARGSVATYYPEGNCLIPITHHDSVSGTPSYKSVPVRISRSPDDGG